MINKILLIDDSPVARMIMKKCLSGGKQYELAEAGDGQAGLEKFKEFHPDVTFLDLTMPVMDGFATLPAILAEQPDAVVIVATADVQEKTISRINQLGAFLLLKKPPSRETVTNALAKAGEYLQKKGGNRMNVENMLSQEEKDILQEVMNIAFGQASADLAEVIDIFVVLNVPFVETIKASELPDYIRREIREHNEISIVEQNYLGKFNGIALLVFPSGASKEISSILNFDQQEIDNSISQALLEKEAIMEIGNILIGACVGKIAELLSDVVTYSPPRVILDKSSTDSVPPEIFDPESTAIIMKTVFSFQDQATSGYFFLINNPQSLNWLQKALVNFLENFA